MNREQTPEHIRNQIACFRCGAGNNYRGHVCRPEDVAAAWPRGEEATRHVEEMERQAKPIRFREFL